jgi:hypothetical protein
MREAIEMYNNLDRESGMEYGLNQVRQYIKESGIEDEFKEAFVNTRDWSCPICKYESLHFTLHVVENDEWLNYGAYALIEISLLDFGKHYITSRYIDAKDLYNEVERVIREAYNFMFEEGYPKIYSRDIDNKENLK